MAKSVQKARLGDTNYDLESNDSRNVLSRCRLKLRDFFIFTNYITNCSIRLIFSIHQFDFFKRHFNHTCF